ncbi:MAG: glycosyltransferase [Candidatus Hodarchaeota archaeon]
MSNIDDEFHRNIEKSYENYDFVFFNPSRKNLDPNRPDYKGNEKFLKAFKLFLNKYPNVKVRLVLGMHGKHVNQFLNLVHQLELIKYCDFIEHLPLPKLHAYMSLKNTIVFDQFRQSSWESGHLGGIQREALSLGSVLVTAKNVGSENFLSIYGKNCPLFPALSVEDIAKAMEEVVNCSKNELRIIQEHAKGWAYKYLHWENRIDHLIDILEAVLAESRARKSNR